MKLCFDLDGTISTNPGTYRDLMMSLVKQGHVVIVLTAAAGELSKELRPSEVKRRLENLGIIAPLYYTQLVCCETCDKGRICADLNVDVIIDDSPEVIDSVKKLSPRTVAWKA